MKLFVLSKENLALARAEAERLHGAVGELEGEILLLDVGEFSRKIAFTREVHEIIFTLFATKRPSLHPLISSFPWHDHIEPPFAVRVHNLSSENEKDDEKNNDYYDGDNNHKNDDVKVNYVKDVDVKYNDNKNNDNKNKDNRNKNNYDCYCDNLLEKDLAGLIWRDIEKTGGIPKVDLKTPKTAIHLFKRGEKIYVTKLLWRNDERFFDRRAHLRPRNHPTSLNPKLARAMINLAGNEIRSVLDPFCGAGGILLEGALAGIEMTGTDIDSRQIKRAEENLAAYGAKASLTVMDAARCSSLGRFDAIVTDLPYGKGSVKADDATLKAFFYAASGITSNMVVASAVDIKGLFVHWRLEAEFSWYIHKGLTKRIFLLKNKIRD